MAASSSSSGPLGQRVLHQLQLGLRDDQNDIDLRDDDHRETDAELRRQYRPRSNGQVVNRANGAAVPQAQLFDDLHINTEIAYAKRWDNNDDYKLAAATAGRANIGVEAFIEANNVDYNRSMQQQQQALLIEERKKRFLAFSERNTELVEMQKTRRAIEDVIDRLNAIHKNCTMTATRWYWLAGVTGVMPRSAATKSEALQEKMEARPLPFWLLTNYVLWQYEHLDQPTNYAADMQYWKSRGPQRDWGMMFLERFDKSISTLLSLNAQQRRFASALYLTLRDSVLSRTLRLASPTGTTPPLRANEEAPAAVAQLFPLAPDSEDRETATYEGLLLTAERLRSRVNDTTTEKAIKARSVTWAEVASPGTAENVNIKNRDAKLLEKELTYAHPGWHIFADKLVELLTAPTETTRLDIDTVFQANEALERDFFTNGVVKAINAAVDNLDGLDLNGCGGWIGLLQTTFARPDVWSDARFNEVFVSDLHLKVAVNGQNIALKLIYDDAVTEAVRLDAFAYGFLWGDNTLSRFMTTVEFGDAPSGRTDVVRFRVTTSRIPAMTIFTMVLSDLSPTLIAALQMVGSNLRLLLAQLDLLNIAGVQPGFSGRCISDINRVMMFLLFWSLGLRTEPVVEALLKGFNDAVRGSSTMRSDNKALDIMKAEFETKTPFLRRVTEDIVPLLQYLQNDHNMGAHFYRELIRTTFVGAYSRDNIDPRLRMTANGYGNQLYTNDVKVEAEVIPVKSMSANTISAVVAPVVPVDQPYQLNDTIFFETWEKMYANLFLVNRLEYVTFLNADATLPYWRTSFEQNLASSKQAIQNAPDQANKPFALTSIWQIVSKDRRFVTRMQQNHNAIPEIHHLMLKLVKGMDPEDDVAVKLRLKYNSTIEFALAHWDRNVMSARMRLPLPNGTFRETSPAISLLQALMIFALYFYPVAVANLQQQLDKLDRTQTRMVDLLQASLTNDPSLALGELKQLAHETYLPDARYHMQSKYTGRLVFTELFIAATHAAYADLQHLAHLPPPPEFNMYGKRSRAVPIDYRHLQGVPLDVLSANTDPAVDEKTKATTRDYVDMTTTSTSTLMMLRSGMAGMIAQFIFDIRLDAPDQYKSVIQHKRAPLQLAAAQKTMAKFRFSKTGKLRGWTVTIEY
jgi:hypothetical protein